MYPTHRDPDVRSISAVFDLWRFRSGFWRFRGRWHRWNDLRLRFHRIGFERHWLGQRWRHRPSLWQSWRRWIRRDADRLPPNLINAPHEFSHYECSNPEYAPTRAARLRVREVSIERSFGD